MWCVHCAGVRWLDNLKFWMRMRHYWNVTWIFMMECTDSSILCSSWRALCRTDCQSSSGAVCSLQLWKLCDWYEFMRQSLWPGRQVSSCSTHCGCEDESPRPGSTDYMGFTVFIWALSHLSFELIAALKKFCRAGPESKMSHKGLLSPASMLCLCCIDFCVFSLFLTGVITSWMSCLAPSGWFLFTCESSLFPSEKGNNKKYRINQLWLRKPHLCLCL